MWKLALGLIADILYMKGILCYEELDAIYNVKDAEDIDKVSDKIIRGDFNVYKQRPKSDDFEGNTYDVK